MDHVALAQTPEAWLFFFIFKTQRHAALGSQGATQCVIGETSLCQGDLCGVEVMVGS